MKKTIVFLCALLLAATWGMSAFAAPAVVEDFETRTSADLEGTLFNALTDLSAYGLGNGTMAIGEGGFAGKALLVTTAGDVAATCQQTSSAVIGAALAAAYTDQGYLALYMKSNLSIGAAFAIFLTDGVGRIDSNSGYLLKDKAGSEVTAESSMSTYFEDSNWSWADGRYVVIPAGFEGWVLFSLAADKLQRDPWNGFTDPADMGALVKFDIDARVMRSAAAAESYEIDSILLTSSAADLPQAEEEGGNTADMPMLAYALAAVTGLSGLVALRKK